MKPEFKRLENWHKELNICIRCGYCYEMCHLFKSNFWEVDTPRAKLVLLFRLLNGEVECTDEIADKIAECFHCKNCERSCAAKVPVTEIIQDAKADLADAGFVFRGTAAEVDDEVCGHCGVCTSVCKAEAITIDDEKKRIVDPVKCVSCGTCIASCPSGAIKQTEGFRIQEADLRESMMACLTGGE
jgi:ferredoxin